MGRGQFIILEGVDGSGTTTQARMLTEAFRDEGRAVHLTQEPSNGPVGSLLRLFLNRRMVVEGRRGPRPPRMETMALLFAADRIDHLEQEILPLLRDNFTVICDRYIHSSLAYQSVTAGDDDGEARQWVETINSRAHPPDLVLLLDVPADVATKRRYERGGAQEMYEKEELQKRIGDFYRTLPEKYPTLPMVTIDGDRDPQVVHQDCLAQVQEALC